MKRSGRVPSKSLGATTGLRLPSGLLGSARALTYGFWLSAVVVPLGFVLHRSLRGASDGEAAGAGAGAISSLFPVLRSTLEQAGWSTFFSLALGTGVGLWLGAPPRAPRWALRILALPFSIPTVAAALVGVQWLGRGGYLEQSLPGIAAWAYSMKAVIAMHVLLNAPWVALGVSRARAQVPERELEAAKVLGASWGSRLRWVIWPRLTWDFSTLAVQVFALCAMSFSLVLILGGGPPVETLETVIYSKMRSSFLDIRGAAGAAFLQFIVTLLPWAWVSWRTQGRTQYTQFESDDRGSFFSGTTLAKSLVILGALMPFFALPLSLLASNWVAERGGVLGQGAFWAQVMPSFLLSLKIALSVAGLALALGVCAVGVAARDGKLTRFFLSLSSGVSVLVLGLGFWLAYGRWVDPFEGSGLAIVVLQAAIFFPVVYRGLWPLSLSAATRKLEAALVLGASPARAWWCVEWPRWRGALLSLGAVVAASSLGEVAAVSLFYSENLIPLPLLAQRWAGQYRFEEARALAALLMVISALTVLMVGEREEKNGD